MITRRAICVAPAVAALAAGAKPGVMTVDLRTGGPYVFPPTGKAYRENAASHRIWRRVFIEAPDEIVVRGDDDFGLRDAVPSGLQADQARRMARPPKEWLAQLSGQYGRDLPEMVYTLSFSVWGRLRAGQAAAVKPILEPFLNGRLDSLAKPTASHYSGHLTLAALFEMTGDTRAKDRVIAAARLARENPRHNEMSDAVFMVCPLLTKAGKFTGDTSYYDAMLRHFDVMRKLCLRPDGLYRHSPLDEAAWGRGNAFPLLGLALTLTDLPESHAAYKPIREAYARHAAKLVSLQTRGGCWRQVIDKENFWEEFTCTAMIGWALRRGLTQKWLRGRAHEQAVTRAWQAVQRRTGADGVLIDVCESTGKQKSLADYYNREAIFAKDPRGGSMAIHFAAEMSGV
ncbi:MAG: glycoside hydrolase family 88 protein [Acidobacteria bacterium]|nr:glycoside hydrolase family 88 protein [Acidobacteriota bacterium]